MRPRRAKAKPRLTRMDAACDHLGRMGFPREEVRRTVNHLLKEVYRGDDAWVFLEEDSYRVVIEAMLEKQEAGPEEPPKPDSHPQSPIGPLETCESVNDTCCIGETSLSHEYLVEKEDVKNLKSLDISGFSSSISEYGELGDLHSPDTVYARDAHKQEKNDGENCIFIAHCHSTRRRPACYGWISEDEDEIVHALPSPTCKKKAMVHCSLGSSRDRKRKSRWDLKPDDKCCGSFSRFGGAAQRFVVTISPSRVFTQR